MATKPREGIHHQRERSISAPSSPPNHHGRQTSDQSSPRNHYGRATSEDSTTEREVPLRRKPMPNYLRPTISSCNEICPYANKSLRPPAIAAIATKRLSRRRSLEKLAPSPAPSQISPKDKSSKSFFSPRAAASPRAPTLKALKIEKVASPKSARTPRKRREADVATPTKPKAPAPKKGSAQQASSPARDCDSSFRGDVSDDHYEGSGESMAGDQDSRMKAARRGKPTTDVEVDSGPRRLKFRQGREVGGEEVKAQMESVVLKRATRKESPPPEVVASPRKLKFRPGREEGREEVKAEERESVALKKQEAKEKKESPPSNEVIEEAASKLAAKRRNKVAALVGAFETVMSLYDQPEQNPPQAQEKVGLSPRCVEPDNAVISEVRDEVGDSAELVAAKGMDVESVVAAERDGAKAKAEVAEGEGESTVDVVVATPAEESADNSDDGVARVNREG